MGALSRIGLCMLLGAFDLHFSSSCHEWLALFMGSNSFQNYLAHRRRAYSYGGGVSAEVAARPFRIGAGGLRLMEGLL